MTIKSYDVRPINAWDSFALGEEWLSSTGYLRLFGNLNVGKVERCNLQAPGQLRPWDAWIEHLYARTDGAPRASVEQLELHKWASYVEVRLMIGDRPCCEFALADLLQERPWEPEVVTDARLALMDDEARAAWLQRQWQGWKSPRPLSVPARQNFSVEVCASTPPPPGRIWIHVEGFDRRERQ